MTAKPMDTCFLCEHCYVQHSTGAYSDVTPGDDWTLMCLKAHFHVEGRDTRPAASWHETITKSRTCPDAEATQ